MGNETFYWDGLNDIKMGWNFDSNREKAQIQQWNIDARETSAEIT